MKTELNKNDSQPKEKPLSKEEEGVFGRLNEAWGDDEDGEYEKLYQRHQPPPIANVLLGAVIPLGFELVTEGVIKIGDIILSSFLGYCEWDTIVTEDVEGWYHYLGYDKKGADAINFKGVARYNCT